MKTTYEENIDFEDTSFENDNFNDEDIYEELKDLKNFDDLSDRGTCVECGDPNGYLNIDPYSEYMHEENINVYLCSHCSNNLAYI